MSRKLHWLWCGLCSLLILAVLGGIAGLRTAHGPFGSAPERNESVSLLALTAQAQETAAEPQHAGGSEPAEAEEEGHSVREEIFHWANFVLILGGIWYLIRKLLVPFLEARGRAIREEMERSTRAMAEANQRLSVVEKKIERLDEEIAALRHSASQEAAAERARIEEMANADANKILAAAEQEMEAAVKAARQELKAYAAEQALGVAEKKIQDSLTPQAEQRILRSFLQELTRKEPSGGNGGPSHPTGGES